MDVTKREDWDRALDFAKSTFGGIHILVNNAGWTYRRKDTLMVSDSEYDSSLSRGTSYKLWQNTNHCIQESSTSTSKAYTTPPTPSCRIS